jgi:hypothetical protein
MKILIVTNNLKEKDGWSRYSSIYVTALKAEGNEAVIISEEDGGGDFPFLRQPSKYARNIFFYPINMGKNLSI